MSNRLIALTVAAVMILVSLAAGEGIIARDVGTVLILTLPALAVARSTGCRAKREFCA